MMTSRSFWDRMKPLNKRLSGAMQRGFGPKKLVLLLITTGRKSGLPRITPLQYEEFDGDIYVASARGQQADWVQNITADPHVQVRKMNQVFDAVADTITEPTRIADFLELRLKRHPIMIRLIMCLFEGLPWRSTRAELEQFSKEKVIVIIHPI